jgi:hypothetical protein
VIEPTDGRFDVPLAPVRPAATDRRRARAVLIAAAVLVVVAIGLAALSRDEDRRVSEAATPATTAGSAPASTGASAARSAAMSPAATSRRKEDFLPLPNQPLTGAATTTLVHRDGDDAEVLGWSPGDAELRSLRRFPGAFGGLGDDPQIATLSPDARSLLIVVITAAGSIEGRDHARLVTAAGGIAWEADGVTGLGSAVWSADSGSLVVPGAPGRWWLVTVDRSGGASGRNLSIYAEPAPTAAPSVGAPWVRVVPIGFSSDGRWIYAARVDIGRGLIEATTRVAVDDGTVEPIGDFSTGPERLDERARGILDPSTGRSVMFGANASIPGGPPTVEVKEADGTIAFRVEGRVVYGTAWTADGRLLVLDADGLPFPTGLRLRLLGADGVLQGTLLETGPLAGGGMVGVADGFVHVAFMTERPARELQLVVVRIADGATSAIVVPSVDGILAGGLLP